MKTKNILLSLAVVANCLLSIVYCFSQAPQAFKYQSIVRNAAGNPMASTNISVRATVHDSTATGTIVYQETQTAATNPYGLINLEIGNGTIIIGTFSSINWASGNKWMQIEADFGSGYVPMGTSQLLSVPYALYSGNGVTGPAGPVGPAGPPGANGLLDSGSVAGNTPFWNGTQWVVNSSNIFNNGGNVGVGTTAPASKLHVLGDAMIGTGVITYSTTPAGSGLTLNGSGSLARLAMNDGSANFTQYLNSYYGGGQHLYAISAAANRFTTSTGNYGFYVAPPGTAGSPITWTPGLYINNSGNVGIGTTAPTQKLEINGNAKISGLAGTGNRMVVTDPAGTLSAQAIPLDYDNNIIVVKNAIGDGITDDTQAIQFYLDSAIQRPGCVVFLPNGKYKIDGTLMVRAYSTLQGTYQGPGDRPGTTLLATGFEGQVTGYGCIVLGFGMAELKNMRIEYPNQSANDVTPKLYPFAITGYHSARIEEVFLRNPYQGINFDEAHANMIRNVWGNPLKTGIYVDHCFDISRIENVHFWPFFVNGKAMEAWVQNNGVGFLFGRSDWQYALNCFTFGYYTGFKFFEQTATSASGLPGGKTNGQFVGCGVDKGSVCVDIEGCYDIGLSFTHGLFASFGSSNGRCIRLQSTNTGNATFTNCNFWANTASVAEVQGGSLNISSCNIDSWALTQTAAYCFVLGNGRLNVNNSTFNQAGNVASLNGASSRANFIGNMAIGTLTVSNGIGTRFVNVGNNPAIP